MIIEHREDDSDIKAVLASGKFTQVVMMRTAQKDILDNFENIPVKIDYTKAAKVLNRKISTVYESFNQLCKNNKVEFALIVNGDVVGVSSVMTGNGVR